MLDSLYNNKITNYANWLKVFEGILWDGHFNEKKIFDYHWKLFKDGETVTDLQQKTRNDKIL